MDRKTYPCEPPTLFPSRLYMTHNFTVSGCGRTDSFLLSTDTGGAAPRRDQNGSVCFGGFAAKTNRTVFFLREPPALAPDVWVTHSLPGKGETIRQCHATAVPSRDTASSIPSFPIEVEGRTERLYDRRIGRPDTQWPSPPRPPPHRGRFFRPTACQWDR